MKTVHPDIFKFLDHLINYKWRYDRLSGLSIGISTDKKILFHGTYGFSNVQKRSPTKRDTAYRIASVSKVFTAIAILKLAESGKLKLSDPAIKYLPEIKTSSNHQQNKITIAQLLTHTSLITRDGTYGQWNKGQFPRREILFQQAISGIKIKPTGTRWKYSNIGYSFLGLIVEKASGQSYEQYIEQKLLKPLKMTHTAPSLATRLNRHLATGYIAGMLGIKQRKVAHFETYDMTGATGFSSTVPDLLKFAMAIIKQDKRILSPQSWKLAFKKQWTDKEMWRTLILMATKKDNRAILTHGGSFPGFVTRLGIDMKNKFAVAVLINMNSAPGLSYLNTALSSLHHADKLIKQLAKFKTKPRNPEQYEGMYFGQDSPMIITEINKQLIAYDPTNPGALQDCPRLEYISKDKFRIHEANGYGSDGELVTFKFNPQNKVIGVDWAGYYMKFKKI